MQIHRPILCEECQYAAKARILRPSRTIEPRFSRSDYIPSESERIQLRNVLKEGEREIECYEGLWAILDQLETRKRALELTTIQCRAALSVHRRIPAEVWGMIFSTLCLELHEYSFDVDVDDVSPLLQLPALLISQVCSRWRNIVQGLPSVWSSINADAFHWNGYRTFNDPLKVYLAHSKGYPLTLRIAFPELLTPCVYNVWNTLSRHIGRSRKLTMAVD
ncbi:hypothetical protein L218DRAFT_575060 [Marasmius fiardii PR-910]|nr:hypothetical protein L218DRAFT_575060 [Marasmius fiardii PR-910]